MKIIGAPGDKIMHMVTDEVAAGAVRLWLAELIRDGLAVVTLDGRTLGMVEYLDLSDAERERCMVTPDPSLGFPTA